MIALLVALGVAALVSRGRAGLGLRLLGGAIAVAGTWLLTQPVRAGGTTWVVAATIGGGLGLLLARARVSGSRRWPVRLTAGACAFLSVAVTAWVGANTAVPWFGRVIDHGPRDVRQVAITFDDGPDVRYSLAVRDILDAYGVKATFFTVGRAMHALPEVSQALLDDGELLGNHSYVHDYRGWLDPHYAELGRTQREFSTDLGVCPTFFRPPHGQHTPFMARVVHHERMATVTWDVSARDWSSHDGTKVAHQVLARVRPGSIILLHDGLDGKLRADRSVLLTALPLILDGLRAQGLQPVRLDQLLGKPAYAGGCARAGAPPAAR